MYKLNGLEALGNKASPRERCPRGQRRRCFAQDSAGMDGHKKKQPGMGPQNPRKKRATIAGKSGPTAGKKSIGNCRQTTNNHHSYRDPQTQITQRDGRDVRQSSTEALTVQTVHDDRKLSSHSSTRAPSRSAQRQIGFRRSWRFLRYSAMMRSSNSSPQCTEDSADTEGPVHREAG